MSIFHPDFIYHHRATVNSAGLARVLIERIVGRGEWNPATGLVTGAMTTPLYQGRARIQKVAFPTNRSFAEDTAKFQRVRVQIGFEDNELTPSDFELKPNDRITVLYDPSDASHINRQYYVHGDETSSNSWQRTITAQTNMKQE
jgi:Family of unknown function (DUF6093)